MAYSNPSRRRILRIFASGVAVAATGRPRDDREEWRGAALGAEVSIVFEGEGGVDRRTAIASILAEIERQEAIFSLQDARSELSRLNAEGRLLHPSADFVHVLSVGLRLHAATRGKFDPTVQGLWRYYVDWYAQDRGRARPPDDALRTLAGGIGFDAVRILPDSIVAPAGVAMTLNGIAQGHITDRGVSILRDLGFTSALVDLGETRAIGSRRDGAFWRVALPDSTPLHVRDGAVSTSAGAATCFADNGDHHIFDPHTRRPARIWNWLTVAHPSATVADGLSTGLYCLPQDQFAQALKVFPQARVWARANLASPS